MTSSVKPFMDRFLNNDDYPRDMFLLKEEAPEYVDSQTAVIVVDVNKAKMTECPALLDICKTIIVLTITDSQASLLQELFCHMLTHMPHQRLR